MIGWLCVIGVALIVAAIALYLSLVALNARLLDEGTATSGTIVSKEIHETTNGMRVRQRRTTYSFFVSVRYDLDGIPQTQLHKISETFYNATLTGAQVPVIYLADRPDVLTLENGRELRRESRAAYVFAGLGVLMIALGLYLHRFLTARADLRRNGVAVRANVSKIQFGNGGTALTYEFTSADGTSCKGAARRTGRHWGELKVGSPIAVIHHPQRPKLHMLEMDAQR
ncbi:MAG: DUF3592 domain-containing protein [Octadecabacter sp.]